MGAIKQLVQLLVTVAFICGTIITLGTMFPDGELGAGAGELGEGFQLLFSAVGDAVGGVV